MQLIKNKEIVEDHWQHLTDEPIPLEGDISVSYSRWNLDRDALLNREGALGLRISPDNSVEEFVDDLHHFQLIGLEFPVFTDGRLFSVASILRHHYKYKGEIRALGAFIRDQIFFLTRVGVNSFEMADPTHLQNALPAIDDFTVHYQSANDVTE